MTYDHKVCHVVFHVSNTNYREKLTTVSTARRRVIFKFFTIQRKASEQYIPVVLLKKMLYILVSHAFEWYHVNFYYLKILRRFLLAPIPRLIFHNQLALTMFRILLTPSLLLIAKYTQIILEMLITIDHSFSRTNIKQFTILHFGPKLWNSLPKILRNWQVTLVSRLR